MQQKMGGWGRSKVIGVCKLVFSYHPFLKIREAFGPLLRIIIMLLNAQNKRHKIRKETNYIEVKLLNY